MIGPCPRHVTHRYIDPLDEIWMGAAGRIGYHVARTREAYATSDGDTLWIGEPDTLDPDDCLAQVLFHELCHALVAGPVGQRQPDWGLCNETLGDLAHEHACLRVQAHLAGAHGLRAFLAPTTEHRAFYDALGDDALAGANGDDAALDLARAGCDRARAAPMAPHLERALAATRAVLIAARPFAQADSLLSRFDDG